MPIRAVKEVEEIKGCAKKISYSTRSKAIKGASKVAGKYQGKSLHPYKCKYCSGWHLTKQKQEKANV